MKARLDCKCAYHGGYLIHVGPCCEPTSVAELTKRLERRLKEDS
jgi:hypothetical protein